MFFFLCLEHTDSADKCLINKQITEKAASEHIKPFAQGLQSHLSSLGQLHTAVFHHIQSCKIKFPLTRPITITPCRLSLLSLTFSNWMDQLLSHINKDSERGWGVLYVTFAWKWKEQPWPWMASHHGLFLAFAESFATFASTTKEETVFSFCKT